MTQMRPHSFIVPLVISAIPIISIVIAHIAYLVPFGDMTRDVSAIAGLHPFFGVLSSLGILLWWTSASIFFFSAYLLKHGPSGGDFGLMVYSGYLSCYLGLDDLFQIHELVAPKYLGIPEIAVYAALMLATAIYIYRFMNILSGFDAVLMLLAFVFFGLSVAVDTILEPWLWRIKEWEFLVEDGLKWFGICLWNGFCILRCVKSIKMGLLFTPETI